MTFPIQCSEACSVPPHGLCCCIVVQSPSRVRLFVTPWTTARQASLPLTISQSLPKFISIESVMPSNHFMGYQSSHMGYKCFINSLADTSLVLDISDLFTGSQLSHFHTNMHFLNFHICAWAQTICSAGWTSSSCWRRLLRVPWTARRSVSPKGNLSWIFIGRTGAEAEAPIFWLTYTLRWNWVLSFSWSSLFHNWQTLDFYSIFHRHLYCRELGTSKPLVTPRSLCLWPNKL